MTVKHLQKKEKQQNPTCNLSVCVLGSGSKGNAIFISDGSTSILVDAGLSGIEIERRLKSKGLSPENLDAILVSHEHVDHIKSAGVLSRRFDLPVYISCNTGKVASTQLGTVKKLRNFECGSAFKIKNLTVHPFSLPHDAKDPSGFTVRLDSKKIGIATDLGTATAMVKSHLKDCALLILEANHDPAMLENGPYPWPLKQRIKSRTGHLSNEASKILLKELLHDRLQHVILAHLSEINNTPQKAVSVIEPSLTSSDTKLHVAFQDRCGDLLHLK
ncbi:MBL fold metallo-hydrolase [Thermodesulfobacteriota bacterium]